MSNKQYPDGRLKLSHIPGWTKYRAMLLKELPPVCGICNKEIDMELSGKDRYGPVVDHIIPLSKGGDPFDKYNCRLTHMICNSKRQDRTEYKGRRW